MIYELMTFTCLPLKRGKVVELTERLLPLRKKHDMKVTGTWTTFIGRYQQVIQLLAFDSLADLEKKRTAFNKDPDFLNIMKTTEPCIQYEDTIILKPTAQSPLN